MFSRLRKTSRADSVAEEVASSRSQPATVESIAPASNRVPASTAARRARDKKSATIQDNGAAKNAVANDAVRDEIVVLDADQVTQAEASPRQGATREADEWPSTGEDEDVRPACDSQAGRGGAGEGWGRARRQRQRIETRAQLLERLTNPHLSLHEAGILLGVCAATVRRYCDSGRLPHARTAGGQRRFRLREVLSLMREMETQRKEKQRSLAPRKVRPRAPGRK